MSENTVVDFTSLNAFSGGDKDLMAIHINTFLEFAPAQVNLVHTLTKEQKWGEVKDIAHKLKPKISYMGIKSLTPVIEEVESLAGEERELDKIPLLLEEIVSVSNQAFDELKSFGKS